MNPTSYNQDTVQVGQRWQHTASGGGEIVTVTEVGTHGARIRWDDGQEYVVAWTYMACLTLLSVRFPVRTILGERPDGLPELVFHCARPLPGLGIDMVLPSNIWHQSTVRDDLDPEQRHAVLERFRELDAYLVEWVTLADAAAEVRAELVVEYGEEAVDGLADEALLDTVIYRRNGRTVEVA